jgi:hypothetical protein
MQYVVMDQTGPFEINEGSGKFHLLLAVELVTRRCHIIPIRNMATESIIMGLQILCGRRGKWKTLVADEATAHRGLATESTMRAAQAQDISHTLIPRRDLEASLDLVGYLKRKSIQEMADRLKIRFKIVSAKSHHNVGLAEDISRRLKLLSYDTFGNSKVKDTFEAFHRAAIIEGAINDRIIAIEADGSIITPNSFAAAQGLHSNHPGVDLSGMSSTSNMKITSLLEEMKESTKKTLKRYTNHYISHLLQFTRQRHDVKDLATDDVVMILDRVTPHKFMPTTTAVGRITHVSEGQRQFRVKLSRTVFKNPLKKNKSRALFVNRPRKNLVLLVRPTKNQDRPMWVDPWTGVTNQAIVEQGYNPLRVDFSQTFETISPEEGAPYSLSKAPAAEEEITTERNPIRKSARIAASQKEEALYPIAPGNPHEEEHPKLPQRELPLVEEEKRDEGGEGGQPGDSEDLVKNDLTSKETSPAPTEGHQPFILRETRPRRSLRLTMAEPEELIQDIPKRPKDKQPVKGKKLPQPKQLPHTKRGKQDKRGR